MFTVEQKIVRMLVFDIMAFLGLTLFVLIFPSTVMSFDYSVTMLTVFLVILGAGNFIIQKRSKSPKTELFPRFLRDYNFLELVNTRDEPRSRRYSEKFGKITGKDIDIFTFENTGKFPPAFTRSTVRGPSIYIDWKFISQLDEPCLDALILHELGHFKHGDHMKKRLFSNMFVLSLAFAFLSLVLILILSLPGVYFVIPVVLSGTSFLLISTLKLIMDRSETEADKFGTAILGDSGILIRALEEIRVFASSGSYPPNVASKVDRRIARRIERLKNETS